MPTNRKVVFANDEFYHCFNRGVEKRPTFTDKREYSRAIQTIQFYRSPNLPLKFSKFLILEKQKRLKVLDVILGSQKQVEIIAFCLMPNHFHFILKQLQDNGISKFMANFTNSYTKYFNTKNDRVGPLFQGLFKAVHIESNEQLLHLSRYIHLNPVTAFLINPGELESYLWSSYIEYLRVNNNLLSSPTIILNQFRNKDQYQEFVLDQADYGKQLESIKHLIID